jgi:spore coat protein U-like protein
MLNIGYHMKLKGLIVLLFLSSSCGYAAVSEVNNLSFGTIAVLKNDIVSEISIDTNSQITITNHIRVLSPGQRAEYFLSAYPAFTQLFTSANILASETFSPAPSSEQFTLTSLTTAPSVTTDGAGTATVFVGGTLATSGDGVGQYFDTDYTVDFELTINF